jgi:hypothetical protein
MSPPLANAPFLFPTSLICLTLSLAALTTLLSAAVISIRNHRHRTLRHRRLAYGRCPHCGYNRRHSNSILCPECGK